jgi:predicted phage terminase large subunit-like protein
VTEAELAEIPIERIERELGLRSFYEFVQLAWTHKPPGTPFNDGWHIEVICDALERCYRGDPEYRQIAFCIPPGHSKSSLVSVLWPVWCWMQDPTLGIFNTSFDKTLTYRDAAYSLELIQSEWFEARWGDILSVDPAAAIGEHTNSRGGFRFSTSVGGAGTGRHPDIVIIDDPQKPKEVSPNTLAAVESYWNNTLRSRERDPRTVRRVLIMQRLAVRDLAGVLEEEGGWHFVVLPFRFDPARAYPKDRRTEKGEILWSARHSEETARALERMPPRDRAAQLQQLPVPEGGAIIKDEWIKWYDAANSGKLFDAEGKPLPGPPRFVQKIQSWDLAFKATSESDFVAGQLWGVAVADYYFIDGILERLDFVATIAAIMKMCSAHPGSAVLIEDKANGPAVMAALGGNVPGVVAVEPLGGKAARLNAASPLFEGGNVWLPKGHPVAEALAISLVSFPVAPHDDDVDACTQVLNYLHQNFADYAAVMKRFPRGF